MWLGCMNYSGCDRHSWKAGSVDEHCQDIASLLQCNTKSERKQKERLLGCRFSVVTQVPYFDQI